MVKIEFRNLPESFKSQFRISSQGFFEYRKKGISFSKYAEDLIFELYQLEVTYDDHGHVYDFDYIIFKNDQDYTWLQLICS